MYIHTFPLNFSDIKETDRFIPLRVSGNLRTGRIKVWEVE